MFKVTPDNHPNKEQINKCKIKSKTHQSFSAGNNTPSLTVYLIPLQPSLSLGSAARPGRIEFRNPNVEMCPINVRSNYWMDMK